MKPEGQAIEHRGMSPRARRFLEICFVVVGMLTTTQAEAGERSPKNTWAQLMGENVEERGREITQLERQCETLERQIMVLRERIADEDSVRYARDPGLRFEEKGKLRAAERELRQKQAAIESLREGAERGAQQRAERRARQSEAVEDTPLEFLDPTLDLSAGNLGNESITSYYERYNIRFSDHRLYMDSKDMKRLALTVGPELTDADFFFTDKGRDLMIVFTATDGTHKTLVLDDGKFGSFFDSNERGNPVQPEID